MPARPSPRRCAAYFPAVLVAGAVAGGLTATPASAASATSCQATHTVIIGPGDSMTYSGAVTSTAGAPVAGVTLGLDRWSAGAWRPYLHLTTDSAGRARFPLRPTVTTGYRIRWGGNSSWAPCVAAYSSVWLSNDPHVLASTAAHNGAPYQWGAAGPSSFDCSGLMLYVFAHFGRSLPHSSQLQYSGTHHIATSSLQPGDMVFFGTSTTGIYHVGMYAGGGNVWHAPGDGQTVKLQKIWTTAYYAGRI